MVMPSVMALLYIYGDGVGNDNTTSSIAMAVDLCANRSYSVSGDERILTCALSNGEYTSRVYLFSFVLCPIRFAVPSRAQETPSDLHYVRKKPKKMGKMLLMMMNAFFLFSIGFLFPFDCSFNKI